MDSHYHQLCAEERACIMQMTHQGLSLRQIAAVLRRAPSSISREIRRNTIAVATVPYDAAAAGRQARQRLRQPRRPRKLQPHSAVFIVVADLLRQGWSPQQIQGRLRERYPDDSDYHVSHETIYAAIYATPRGELRKDLIRCLRQGHDGRRKRSQGEDRCGRLPDMVSIHERPPEVEGRLIPGHWEADLIKGAGNRSAVATLVERTSRLVMLARMPDASAASALEALPAMLNRIPEPSLRQTLTYDQGREMSRHKELTARTGVRVYFADPHSPWQRGSNENANGLIREYLPKGTDLSVHSQEELDAIAHRLNTRPRAVLGFKMPIEVFAEHLDAVIESLHAVKH